MMPMSVAYLDRSKQWFLLVRMDAKKALQLNTQGGGFSVVDRYTPRDPSRNCVDIDEQGFQLGWSNDSVNSPVADSLYLSRRLFE